MISTIQISAIDVRLADNMYTVDELVNDIYRDKLDKEVREHFTRNLGLETVYKSHNLSKDSLSSPQELGDVYVQSAESVLKKMGKDPSHLGQLITINDNSQRYDPAPTTEIVSRMGLREDVNTQNSQGMACSAIAQSFRSAVSNCVLPNSRGDTLVLASSFYTDWFLPMFEGTEKISMENKRDLNSFAYFLIFSDAVGCAYMSGPEKIESEYKISVDLNMTSTRKDNTPHGWEKTTLKPRRDFVPDMKVDSRLLRETSARLSAKNVSYLRSRFPQEYQGAKIVNLHTAGKNFMDAVARSCDIPEEKTKLSYDMLRETGNTGAVSAFQLMKESVERKFLGMGDYGLMIDYGWEGADSFLYKVL